MSLARWGFAIAPLTIGWGLVQALTYGLEFLHLKERSFHTLGAAVLIGILLWGRPRSHHRRRHALVQIGASTGAALASAPLALYVAWFLLWFAINIPLMLPELGLSHLGAAFMVWLCAIPLTIAVVCTRDAWWTLRRIRNTPLGWGDCGWILAGLLPAAALCRLSTQIQGLISPGFE